MYVYFLKNKLHSSFWDRLISVLNYNDSAWTEKEVKYFSYVDPIFQYMLESMIGKV